MSGQYVETISRCEDLNLVAVADLDRDRAAAVAEPHDATSGDLEELLNCDELDVVLNLTVPQVQTDVSLAAIEAGVVTWRSRSRQPSSRVGRGWMLHATPV